MKDSLSCQIPETGDVEVVSAISRAGKATGSKQDWWNVQVLNTGVQKSLNLEAVRDLKECLTF